MGDSATTKIQITDRQQVTLALFLLNSVKPANRDERRRYRRAFAEFKLLPFKDKIVNGKFDGSTVKDEPCVVEVSGDPVDYVLEKVNAPTDGIQTFPLLEVEEILLAVQNNQYQLPSTDTVTGG